MGREGMAAETGSGRATGVESLGVIHTVKPKCLRRLTFQWQSSPRGGRQCLRRSPEPRGTACSDWMRGQGEDGAKRASMESCGDRGTRCCSSMGVRSVVAMRAAALERGRASTCAVVQRAVGGLEQAQGSEAARETEGAGGRV